MLSSKAHHLGFAYQGKVVGHTLASLRGLEGKNFDCSIFPTNETLEDYAHSRLRTVDECLPSGLHLQLPVEIFCDLENAAVANTEEFYQNVFNKTSVFVAAIALGDDRPSKP